MAIALVLSFALQQLSVSPYPSASGEPVVATLRQNGAPMAGVALSLELAGGNAVALTATDAAGEVRFAAPEPGEHFVTAQHGELRIVAPLRVVAVPSRWLPAAACVPLGLLLLWQNLRAVRRRRSP